jgi:hypothetical protein
MRPLLLLTVLHFLEVLVGFFAHAQYRFADASHTGSTSF